MVLWYLPIVVLCLYKLQFAFMGKNKLTGDSKIYPDYISLDKTASIKGIFILLILLRHGLQYLTIEDNFLSMLYYKINGHVLGQSVVVMFLFYSGFGVMLSIAKKGKSYISSIPTNRMLKVLLHFDIAVLIYLVIQTIFGERYSLYTILSSLIGWENVGNSSWYIFAILALYLVTYFAFTVFKKAKNYYLPVAVVFVLTICMIVALKYFKQDIWWYDTIILYPIGMLYYLVHRKVEAFFNKKAIAYWLTLGAMCVLFVLTLLRTSNFFVLEIKHILFTFIIVLATMKIQIHNKALQFLGNHLFSIFILQRIPMIILDYFGVSDYPFVFLALSLALTILICIPFDMLMDKLDALLFKKKKAKV